MQRSPQTLPLSDLLLFALLSFAVMAGYFLLASHLHPPRPQPPQVAQQDKGQPAPQDKGQPAPPEKKAEAVPPAEKQAPAAGQPSAEAAAKAAGQGEAAAAGPPPLAHARIGRPRAAKSLPHVGDCQQ